jgi:hypothetical protein
MNKLLEIKDPAKIIFELMRLNGLCSSTKTDLIIIIGCNSSYASNFGKSDEGQMFSFQHREDFEFFWANLRFFVFRNTPIDNAIIWREYRNKLNTSPQYDQTIKDFFEKNMKYVPEFLQIQCRVCVPVFKPLKKSSPGTFTPEPGRLSRIVEHIQKHLLAKETPQQHLFKKLKTT